MPVLKAAMCVALVCLCHDVLAQDHDAAIAGKTRQKKIHTWWDERHPGEPLTSPLSRKLPLISVRGNRFVDPDGNTVLFRGLSISDPDKIESQGHWSKKHFSRVKETGARLVRIPVHPVAWRDRTPEHYLALLDSAVGWCTELGMYVIIDWHSIGNLKSGLFQDPMYNTSMAETFAFWRTIARHFKGHNTVAFYELFNEPTLYFNQLGRMSWDEWKGLNEDLISVIRAFDGEKIPLVGLRSHAAPDQPGGGGENRLRDASLSAQADTTVGAEMGRGFRICGRTISPYRDRNRFYNGQGRDSR